MENKGGEFAWLMDSLDWGPAKWPEITINIKLQLIELTFFGS